MYNYPTKTRVLVIASLADSLIYNYIHYSKETSKPHEEQSNYLHIPNQRNVTGIQRMSTSQLSPQKSLITTNICKPINHDSKTMNDILLRCEIASIIIVFKLS